MNDGRPDRVVNRIRVAAEGLSSPIVACLGLAFKPDIDDLRESPAVDVAMNLAALAGFTVLAVEPNIQELPARIGEAGVELVDLETALSRADLVVLLVDHKIFKDSAARIAQGGRVIDTRGILPRPAAVQ